MAQIEKGYPYAYQGIHKTAKDSGCIYHEDSDALEKIFHHLLMLSWMTIAN